MALRRRHYYRRHVFDLVFPIDRQAETTFGMGIVMPGLILKKIGLSLCLGFYLALFLGTGNAAFANDLAAEKTQVKPRVRLTTDLGDIVIQLFPSKAPVTVKNFLDYVDARFYDGVIFHRVVPGFVVQTGGLTFDFVRKQTREQIVNESGNGLKNLSGTLAMARYSDPDSASSQFFINFDTSIVV